MHFEELLQRYLANGSQRPDPQTNSDKQIKSSKKNELLLCEKKALELQSSNKYKCLHKHSSWIYQKVHVAPFHPNCK